MGLPFIVRIIVWLIAVNKNDSPRDGLFHHISCLEQLARLDFERFDVTGEAIFKVDGDASPVSQQDEESRIGTLACAPRKRGNRVDAEEFIRCLNAIC